RIVGEWLQAQGAAVSTPHPIDLLLTSPVKILVEAKSIRRISSILAIRTAVGQLLEYRRFIGPRDAELCILLDDHPGDEMICYVEDDLQMGIAWMQDGALYGGPRTVGKLIPVQLKAVSI